MPLIHDISKEEREVQLNAFRAMTPEQRVAIAIEMSEALMSIRRARNRDRLIQRNA